MHFTRIANPTLKPTQLPSFCLAGLRACAVASQPQLGPGSFARFNRKDLLSKYPRVPKRPQMPQTLRRPQGPLPHSPHPIAPLFLPIPRLFRPVSHRFNAPASRSFLAVTEKQNETRVRSQPFSYDGHLRGSLGCEDSPLGVSLILN